jgi:hypothetical protein
MSIIGLCPSYQERSSSKLDAPQRGPEAQNGEFLEIGSVYTIALTRTEYVWYLQKYNDTYTGGGGGERNCNII